MAIVLRTENNASEQERYRYHVNNFFNGGSHNFAVIVGQRSLNGAFTGQSGWTIGNFLTVADPIRSGMGRLRSGALNGPYVGAGTIPGYNTADYSGQFTVGENPPAGYFIRNDLGNSGWATDNAVDFILSLVGTNDAKGTAPIATIENTMTEYVNVLTTKTVAVGTDVTIMLGRLIEHDPNTFNGVDDRVDAINLHIDGISNPMVVSVDHFNGEAGTSGAPSNVLLASDYSDPTHPFTVSGAKKLARNWTIKIMEHIKQNPSAYAFLLADFNDSGTVDFTDYLTISSNFNTNVDTYEEGDANGDGRVNFTDFLILSQNWTDSSPVPAPPQ